MTAPVGITAQISRGAVAGRSPDFILDRREQLNELFSADPARKHLLWKGVGDLSAEVRLGATEECLLLSVDVTDDVHHPVEPAGGGMAGRRRSILVRIVRPEGRLGAGVELPGGRFTGRLVQESAGEMERSATGGAPPYIPGEATAVCSENAAP